MTIFENMLATSGSAAQETLIDALTNWWMAADREDAIRQIEAAPGEDLAGIENSVYAGLSVLAELPGIEMDDLINEKNLSGLADASPIDIVFALDAIHTQWIDDNFSAKRWAEKYFNGQLFQYRKTAKLPWRELLSDLLFIRRYLKRGGNTCSEEEIQEAFELYAQLHDDDDDLEEISEKARIFADEIINWISAYRNKLDSVKKSQQIAEINEFLSKHQDGAEIMEIMIESVSE